MQVARLIGAAGSGKTTELLRIMEAALPGVGNDPLNLGLATFTRAARAEAVSRAAAAWGVPHSRLDGDGWFRTIHSTARRCLQVTSKQMLGTSTKDSEWISAAIGVRISTSIDDDTGHQKFIGGPEGVALQCWQYARNTLLPLELVVQRARLIDDEVPPYAMVVRVAELYEHQKRLDDRVDFTDLLLRFTGFHASPTHGFDRVEPMGPVPAVRAWLFDEQQDASPLLDLACKRLVSAPSVQWCYVVGDPFQSIFGFAGSSSECFLSWPAHKERTMPKSFRCPKPILELGERCLRRMHRGYFDRGVAPADHEGSVKSAELEEVVSVARPDEDWLFIARTNHDAKRMSKMLADAGKPSRPVKSQDSATARAIGLTALHKLENGQEVTGSEWARAIELLPITATNVRTREAVPILQRGVRTNWASKNAAKWDAIFSDDIHLVGGTLELAAMIQSGDWCSLVDGGTDWRRQVEKWGVETACTPRIRFGTIHSVKGLEADNVAFLTTIGGRVERGMESHDVYDEEQRLAYVAVTRTRRNLYVIDEYRRGKPVPCLEVL